MSRPRGYLARTLYEKYNNDQFIENYDYSNWYKLPNDGKEILDKWVQFSLEIKYKQILITLKDIVRNSLIYKNQMEVNL